MGSINRLYANSVTFCIRDLNILDFFYLHFYLILFLIIHVVLGHNYTYVHVCGSLWTHKSVSDSLELELHVVELWSSAKQCVLLTTRPFFSSLFSKP